MTKQEKFFIIGLLLITSILCINYIFTRINIDLEMLLLAVVGPISVILGVIITSYIQNQNERRKRINSIALASIDRRLQTHQEAYTLWREIIENLHNDDEIAIIVKKCNEWWNTNCLFLEKDAREAFRRSYDSASSLIIFRRTHTEAILLEREMKIIRAAGGIIAKGVELPSLDELEIK